MTVGTMSKELTVVSKKASML